MQISFQVRPDLAYWACDYGKFESGGVHGPMKASAGFVRQIASAEAFGSLIAVDYDAAAAKVAAKAVEPQKVSERKLKAAMRDGRWQEGNVLQMGLELAARDSGEAGLDLGGGN